ncbi:CPBP family intramembrane glutamic endopeptidase, BDIM_20840 family [Caulobacter vibrioides]|uniref:CPBP family intramembrane glutamic endopeptidase, BDIM_20840 family n=1 Tax=Caulobacter vibrioides TaxID=155892 RepID=UPI000BB45A26|nr:CPBP family intramembrane glutamic endopeptidase [Caulobacter vibrioides]ATC25977.1 CPBP family intramembrane metalloprotease [Caulobacter vibrioides]PLR16382.1 CPBP family intramembrane metalloprotease [Caulobacter vibrioides]
MDGLLSIGAILALLLLAGGAIALLGGRSAVSFRWLLAAAGLVLLNDALLTRVYRLAPDLIGGDWNWQGKLAALAATLALAALPILGWRASGLTWRQADLKGPLVVAGLYALLFVGLALAFPNEPADPETLAFQLTMPGLEEEAFYRGVLLLALDRAFTSRVRFLGVDWSWGAALSCALFGLAHAFGVSKGEVSFEPLVFALTAGPSLIAVWLRLRTGSLLLPVLMHNLGNAASLLI